MTMSVGTRKIMNFLKLIQNMLLDFSRKFVRDNAKLNINGLKKIKKG